MSQPPAEPVTPWYKQFWPWALIMLPLTAVVVDLMFISFTLDVADNKVNDNYYKEGLVINETKTEDEAARGLGLSAEVRVNGQQVTLQVDGRDTASLAGLALAFNHPMAARHDASLTLQAMGNGRFEGELAAPLDSPRWYLELRGTAGAEATPWRLRGEWRSALDHAILEPGNPAAPVRQAAPGVDDNNANQHQLQAQLTLDTASNRVTVRIPDADPTLDDISLALRHPEDPRLNTSIPLQADGNGQFSGTAMQPLSLSSHWFLELSGTLQNHSIPWRLQGEWSTSLPDVTLQAEPGH